MCILEISYTFDAFGGFDPLSDKDAAVKYVINTILMEERFSDDDVSLMSVLKPGAVWFLTGTEIFGMGGDGGWEIRRRPPTPDYFKDIEWPEWADFRAYIVPEEYESAYPEFFMTKAQFYGYLRKGINAYLKRHPDRLAKVQPVLDYMEETSDTPSDTAEEKKPES